MQIDPRDELLPLLQEEMKKKQTELNNNPSPERAKTLRAEIERLREAIRTNLGT